MMEIDHNYQCPICSDILYSPVTINCGHTFCRICLVNSLRMTPVCPLCRSPTFLHDPNTLRENITLRSLIENKYSNLYHIRHQQHQKYLEQQHGRSRSSDPLPRHSYSPDTRSGHRHSEYPPGIQTDFSGSPFTRTNRYAPDTGRNIYPTSSRFTSPSYQTFSHTLALKLLDKNKSYVFPDMIETLTVSFPGNVELFKFICSDKKFCCLPVSLKNDFYQLPLFSYHAEVKEIISCQANKIKMEVKILNRIIIDKIENFETQNEELRKHFHLPGGRFTFTVVSGRYLLDEENMNLDPHDVTQLTGPLCEFMQRHLTHVSNSSPNMFSKIIHKLSEINQTTINAQNINDVRNLSKFSFMIAGTFRGKIEEKKKMFETTNVMERLQISKNLSQRLVGFNEPLQVFDVDIPTQSLFSFKYTLILILIICIIIYYIRYVIVMSSE